MSPAYKQTVELLLIEDATQHNEIWGSLILCPLLYIYSSDTPFVLSSVNSKKLQLIHSKQFHLSQFFFSLLEI